MRKFLIPIGFFVLIGILLAMNLLVPSIHPAMLVPLLLMALAFKFYFATVALMRMRNLILERERYTSWITNVLKGKQ